MSDVTIRRWPCRYVPTCKGEMVTVPSREVCKCCGIESCLGFTVPDSVWGQVMGDSQDVICIACFDHQATEHGVAWESAVQFWPVSGVTAAFLARFDGGEQPERVVPQTSVRDQLALVHDTTQHRLGPLVASEDVPIELRDIDGGEQPNG